MKNLTRLILLLLAGIASAQNVVFDGVLFRDKLLQSSISNSIAQDFNHNNIKIDINGDSNIDYSEASAVYYLDVSSSSLVNLVGIEHFVDLKGLVANDNGLTTIDISALANLQSTDVSNNTLQTIYAKNGNNSDTINFNGGSNTNILSYICIDELQIATIQSQLPGSSTCIVNAYCSASPGGNFTTISGDIVFDALGNGIDAGDPKFPYVKVKCTIGSDVFQTTSDVNGHYVFYTQQITGSFSLEPIIENTNAFLIPTSFMGVLGSNSTHDFAILPASTPVPDLEVVVSPVSSAYTGMNATYKVTYKNKGSKNVTGTVLLTYDAVHLTFVSATNMSVSTATTGQVSLSFTDLLPFETRSYDVKFNINSAYTSGNVLNFNATIVDNLGSTETTTAADNTFAYKQTVGSGLINTITCLEGNSVDSSQIGDYLHYGIHFVNSGSAVAKNVVVKAVFDTSKFNLDSLQILNSTNPLDIKVKNNEALFYLNNIAIGGPGGDGGILLKIRSNSGLTAGQTVSSNAAIFFDYGSNFNSSLTLNSNAITNIEATTYQNLTVSQQNIDASILVYPNPSNSIVTIENQNSIKMVQLFDIYGRLLQTNLTDSNKTFIDITDRFNGVYFLKITSDQGTKVERIVKE